MIVPICLFSGLVNYGTQTLSTFMLTSLYFSVQTSYKVLSLVSSVPLVSIARKCCHLLYGPPSTALVVVYFKLL